MNKITCFNSSVYKKMKIYNFAILFLFRGPCLSGQSFVIFAKNFQASILFGFAAFLYICYS